MSNSKRTFSISVTPTRRPKQPRTIDDQILHFEKKLIDLVSDPTVRYLHNSEAFTRFVVKTIQDVRAGVVTS